MRKSLLLSLALFLAVFAMAQNPATVRLIRMGRRQAHPCKGPAFFMRGLKPLA